MGDEFDLIMKTFKKEELTNFDQYNQYNFNDLLHGVLWNVPIFNLTKFNDCILSKLYKRLIQKTISDDEIDLIVKTFKKEYLTNFDEYNLYDFNDLLHGVLWNAPIFNLTKFN